MALHCGAVFCTNTHIIQLRSVRIPKKKRKKETYKKLKTHYSENHCKNCVTPENNNTLIKWNLNTLILHLTKCTLMRNQSFCHLVTSKQTLNFAFRITAKKWQEISSHILVLSNLSRGAAIFFPVDCITLLTQLTPSNLS